LSPESIHISPNPFTEKVTINLVVRPLAHARIDLFDDMGQHIKNITNFISVSGDYKHDINFKDLKLKTGMYFISIAIDGKVNNTKVIFEK
jgi:hypothetical protein